MLGTALGAGLGWVLLTGFSAGTANSTSGFPIVWQPGVHRLLVLRRRSAVAMLSSIIPTRKTARLDPIEVIQNG